MTGTVPNTIAVIDFGGQYTHLITRRIRGLGLYSAIYPPDEFRPEQVPGLVGIILSGGPGSTTEPGAPDIGFEVASLSVPILGLCYGHQLIARHVGGTVSRDGRREYGLAHVGCDPETPLFRGLAPREAVWMSHGDHVSSLPDGYRAVASTDDVSVAAFSSEDGRVAGLQFHPEVSHTVHGTTILDNFVGLCTAKRNWQPDDLKSSLVERVRREAGDAHLFLLISGGVDSLVTLALCIEAVGADRVTSLHVDTGFMRKDESRQVMKHLHQLGFANLHVVDASDRFYGELDRHTDPEVKRKIIGRLFVEVLNDELAQLDLGDDWLLVQGTIYPDTIESGGSDKAATIKTHHNRVEEIERLIAAGKVIEPLDQLYKDEVRVLGESLGLPTPLVNRHPFPGPGLAIRLLCSDGDPPALDPANQDAADRLCGDYGLLGRILPVRSVGVQGDSRTYAHPVVFWAPGGTKVDWESIQECATLVANRIPSVNRAVYSPLSLGSTAFELRSLYARRPEVALLQEVDALVREALEPVHEVWQVPVVALPLHGPLGQVFVMRPVTSRDAMTADFYRMPHDAFRALQERIRTVRGAGYLFLDTTAKPPATIEWE